MLRDGGFESLRVIFLRRFIELLHKRTEWNSSWGLGHRVEDRFRVAQREARVADLSGEAHPLFHPNCMMGMTIEEAKKLEQFRSAKCASNDDAKRPLNTITVSPSSEGT
ncbi:hypothetical protein Tco_0529216 [Tanacetum coccineum]